MATNMFDRTMAEIKHELLNLQQTKQKAIKQIKFAEKRVENITLQRNTSKRFYVEPQNNVNPLLTARIEMKSGSISSDFFTSGKWLQDGKYVFSFTLDQTSADSSVVVDVVFVSTSLLNITEN